MPKFNQQIQDAICNTIHDCVAPIDGFEEETSDAIITALQNAGYVIVPASVVTGTIKSFRDVEQRGSLYDAATHRWIDLLTEVSS